jgi:glycosyltransferase involved in cell wall biosynthesis
MQGAQTESRFRGIGRYTMAFAQAVARNRGEHEIVLALSGLFPESIEPIRSAFEGLLPQENIRVWHVPGPVKEQLPENESRCEVAELLREAFLASLMPDVIHISSLFEGYVDDAVTSVRNFDCATPVSVILYDLIPLQNPGQYLQINPRYETYYRRKIKSLGAVGTYLAISEFSRQEAIDILGIAEEQVVNISAAVDKQFQPLIISANTAADLKQKFRINGYFVLYTGGADERKNLHRLIEAYAALPESLRHSHQLLLAGKMPDGDIARFRQIASKCGLKDDELLCAGYVSDEEVVQLYNLCRLYVFPSWHEGFGLPALEAMACGAAVIGSNSTSLPEVIVLPEALFDPFDVVTISQKMAQALLDDGFNSRLRENGRKQSQRFNWDDTAKRAIAAWEASQLNPNQEEKTWGEISERISQLYQELLANISAKITEKSSFSDVNLMQIARCIERNERQLDQFVRTKELASKITWRIEGPFDSSYSLALVNREVARALASLGHRVALHSTEGPGDFSPNERFLTENSDLEQMHRCSFEVAHVDADVVSRNLYPPRVSDMTARFNFLHAYGWEESGFPRDWINAFNQSLQGVTVMSTHVRKIMLDHGLTIPVAESSLGVDHWHRVEPDYNYHLQAHSFRFLHVSSCFPRKGADVMLRAYGRAFRASDDVSLVIKTFANPHNEIHRWLEEARANDPDFPEVLIMEGDYTDAQLKALYQKCHALVAPSRAEGFGLPMAEAMLSGLAVITTGWSGQTDFCTPDTAWLIDYTFARAKTHFGISASVWAEPDEKHLADLMRDVYLLPENLRQTRIQAGQQLLNEKFNWVQVADRMVDAAKQWAVGGVTSAPRIGWVTTWNTRCGIATYSEHLIKNMQSHVSVLAAHTATKTAEDASNVMRCWSVGDDDALALLSLQVEEQALDTLVIQFNYGFFDLSKFSNFLEVQIGKGLIVVVVMHATNDPMHVPHKKLSFLTPALKRCHRVLVHSPNDMNRLKKLGVIENVALFPHGLVDYVPLSNMRPEKGRVFVVASYGFFLPHKGLLELIDAIALLRKQGIQVRLDMVNAEYPAVESKNIIEQAKAKIQNLHLNGQVNICTDFLTNDEILTRLTKADLIVFPYQATGESSSAAVRYGLASGRPVAVTSLDIFDDVEQAVHVLPGTTPADIADGIALLANQLANANELTRKKEIQAERWRAEHRYTNVGLRLNQMLIALHNQKNSEVLH